MFDIHFETEEEKWQWGGILAGVGVGGIVTITMICCLCKRCLRDRIIKKEEDRINNERLKKINLCVEENKELNPKILEPSAPPYDSL